MTAILSVYGTASPHGRVWQLLSEFNARAANAGHSVSTLDLSKDRLPWACSIDALEDNEAVAQLCYEVEAAKSLLIFSPLYRAAFPGVLKNAFDLIPISYLQGKPISVISVGGSDHHFLAGDHEIRRLAAWFGAFVPDTTSYFVTSKDFENGDMTDACRAKLNNYADAFLELSRRREPRWPITPLAASS